MCYGFRLPFNFKRKRHNCYNCGVVVFCHSCSRRGSIKQQWSLEDDKLDSLKKVEICPSSNKNSSRISPVIANGGLQWEALNISKSFDPVFGSSNKFFSPKILVDDTNDSLSQQEIIKLRAKVENLTLKAQLQEVELERTKNQLKEAIATAGEKTEECNEAKDVIKSLTAQVAAENDDSYAKRSKQDEDVGKEEAEPKAAGDENQKQNKGESLKPPEPPKDYIHVRARRGQVKDSHSLAERVRREKISERMKFLQDLVPGCNKVTGKAVMLDKIINHMQSLQRQVEFLLMKLATVNPRMDFNMDVVSEDIFQSQGALSHTLYPLDSAMPVFPYGYQSQQVPPLHSISNGMETQFPLKDMAERLPVGAARNIKSPSLASFGSSPASNEVSNASIDRMNGQATTFQEPDSNGSISQLLSNRSSTNSNRSSDHNKQPHSDATSRNGNRIKESESRNDSTGWIEQVEPGVYITLTSLPGGVRDLKRVRFSKRLFSENQAEQWWAENRARVYEQYNAHMIDKSSVSVETEDVMNSDEQPSRNNSEKENTLRRST